MGNQENSCSERQHYKNIKELIAEANRIGKKLLADDGYKYGVAQKLLNMYAKYMWCLGYIGEPPHCPVDRFVLGEIAMSSLRWTRMTEKEYKDVIEKIRGLAPSIARWELAVYKRKRSLSG